MRRYSFTKFMAIALVTAGALSAGTMSFDYTTTGTIGGSPPNIVFNPQSIAVTGSTNAAGDALGLALGSFTLTKPGSNTTINYNNIFTLDLVFAAPTVSGPTTFDASLSGTLMNGTGQSGVDLVFNPFSKVVNFSSGSTGWFRFTVHDILGMDNSAGGPATYYLTGDITDTQGTFAPAEVPEPSSVLLLLTGLGGIALAMRRRGIRQGPKVTE